MSLEHHPEAYIVLGGGIDASGRLSDTSMSRVEYASELYHRQRLPFVVSGRWSLLAETAPARTEAAAMREYAIANGVSEDSILVEDESMETVGNAYFTYTRYIKPKGWRAVEVVTAAFHSARALYSFRKVLGSSCTVRMAVSRDIFSPAEQSKLEQRESKIFSFIRELFNPIPEGDAAAIYAALHKLPGYDAAPEYSKEALLQLLAGSGSLGDTYGIKKDPWPHVI
ncbi:MAG: YdcF family protein [Patescibacteria group bacterium]